jgi:DNA-binding MarR family transcriptional regulator
MSVDLHGLVGDDSHVTENSEMTTSERVAFTPLAYEIEFLTVRVFVAGTRVVNKRLRELGLSARSYAALAVACSEIPIRQRDLVALLELDPSQIVALVDELETAGLVRREPNPDDRRTKVIGATQRGRELFERAREVTASAELETFTALDDDERKTLRRLLRKVVFPNAD